MFESITCYLPDLQNLTKFGELISPENLNPDNKIFEQEIIYEPYVWYDPVVDNLGSSIVKFMKDHNEWKLQFYRIIIKKLVKTDIKTMSDTDISNLPAQVLLALLLSAFRSEHFCTGALLDFFENGLIIKWLIALKELDDKQLYENKLNLYEVNYKDNSDVSAFYYTVKNRLEKEDKIRSAVWLAYRDLCRTIRGFSKIEPALKSEIKTNCEKFMREQFEYLMSIKSCMNSENFYSWHYYTTTNLKYVFNRNQAISLNIKTEIPFCFTYGQAQKLVNMFLKYMLLVDDRVLSIIDYLHIPIDNVMLDGIENNFPSLGEIVGKCRPWSRLDNYEDYKMFQEKYREVVMSEEGVQYKSDTILFFENPITSEFYFWNNWSKE